jgi:hypothetical protein
MKKLLFVFTLTMAGSLLWATEGQWTITENGYEISYTCGSELWRSFSELVSDCKFSQEETQFILPASSGYRIVVHLGRYQTEIWVFEEIYVSYFVILK